MRVRPLSPGPLLLLTAGVLAGMFSLIFTRAAKSYGGPHWEATPTPSQVSYPIPVGLPVTTTDRYEILDVSPASKEQMRIWLDTQAKSRRELVAVVSRGETEKPLFVFVSGREAVGPLVISSPDLSKEHVLAQVRAQGPQRRLVGACRAGKMNLLFFQ